MPMGINVGREICGQLELAESREWLVTNGIGGYASGTIAGMLTRCYHGLLVAALNPPLGRTLLVSKLDDIVLYGDRYYPLHTNRWADGAIGPHGYRQIERFSLDGSIPVWRYACADALLEKRIWMQPGANTTYVQYHLLRATQPFNLSLKAMVNYRDYHSRTQGRDWQMAVTSIDQGVCISAYPQATDLFVFSDRAQFTPNHDWYYGFDLAAERERGLNDRDDHLHAATLQASLEEGKLLTIVLTIDPTASLNSETALKLRRTHDNKLLGLWKSTRSTDSKEDVEFACRLVLAADQFVVNRSSEADPNGKTIIAGYHWFSDWGRDTMISLPGLTLETGQPEVARSILQTFARHVSQGVLPNRFPDAGEIPEYNTVDATLWYFEALRAYYNLTEDDDLIRELFPVLADIVDWHCRGTRFNIHLDPADGLLYAGEAGTQLTWMDAKVGDWVVTPRIGKPIEVNALWYNALRTIAKLSRRIGMPHQEYDAIADRALARFSRFWNAELGYCYDVLDGPAGDDTSLRPNQIFAVSLPESPLTSTQQKGVVDTCARALLTSHGLRSLSPDHPDYQGKYLGSPKKRDGAYHQGTVWGWLLGPLIIAHLRVYNNPAKAREFLEPMKNHLFTYGLGSLSEIFDGDAPMMPRGCIAQAWTVAEILRAWMAIDRLEEKQKVSHNTILEKDFTEVTMTVKHPIHVIGGGLAGTEAAWQIAQAGIPVVLSEMRPLRQSPAHHTQELAELVCSNSFGAQATDRASGLLHEELRRLGSIVIATADKHAVPAGGALAVDRAVFSQELTQTLANHPLIELRRQVVTEIPDEIAVLTTGPLTSPELAEVLHQFAGMDYLSFFDAASPIVVGESIDYDVAFLASRYDRGEAAYLNCPLNREQYLHFYQELCQAERAELKDFEQETAKFFEGCLPIEEMARRGEDTMRYGPLKPVGLFDARLGDFRDPTNKANRPYAVVQLRQEDKAGQLWNMVGFQTNLRWGEQKRVFRLIPGLENAEFVRMGVMHRNTFINAPELLQPTLQFKQRSTLLAAGQLIGTEGYTAATAGGWLAGTNAARLALGHAPLCLPTTTMSGALFDFISSASPKHFQPMPPNFGILPELPQRIRNKQERYGQYRDRSLTDLATWMRESAIAKAFHLSA